jgi:hypothetical protein
LLFELSEDMPQQSTETKGWPLDYRVGLTEPTLPGGHKKCNALKLYDPLMMFRGFGRNEDDLDNPVQGTRGYAVESFGGWVITQMQCIL